MVGMVEPAWPMLMFDSDGWLYVLDDPEVAAGWIEPLTAEETTGLYDSAWRPVELAVQRDRVEFEVEPNAGLREMEVREKVRAFVARYSPELEGTEQLPFEQIVSRLRDV